MSNVKSKPILGISMGDPAGIGPEIIIKALAIPDIYEKCKPLVIGDANILQQSMTFSGKDFHIHKSTRVSDARFEFGTIDIIDLDLVNMDQFRFGEISAMCGNAAFQSVKKVIELALEDEIDATVTGPLHKEALNLAGHHYSGHTEIYADLTNTPSVAMLLAHENFRVIHVTTHVSLHQACEIITKDRIVDVIKLMDTACRQFGVSNPRIGVAGLNPHSGDGGLFGDEEIKHIRPAIEQAVAEGLDAEGPVPPDTLFPKAVGGYYDGCVAMYHDQGHIPFKLVGFKWDNEKQQMQNVSGVNITLGLPIIRTSVDHGTAFEIAGKGIASPMALIYAIEYAVTMARSRK